MIAREPLGQRHAWDTLMAWLMSPLTPEEMARRDRLRADLEPIDFRAWRERRPTRLEDWRRCDQKRMAS